MEQVPDLTNSIIITRSFTQERLNRINANPYGTLDRQTNHPSAPASERLLNFVKGKFHGALSTVKKLLEGPHHSSNNIPLLPDAQKRLIIPNERLNGISSLIQETISKPEYQEHYDVYNHRHTDNKKASFLNLLSYYKDVSADRIREKMEESNSWIIPEPVACPLKPVPSRGVKVPVKSRGALKKKYSRKASHSSNNSSMVNMNGKRELNSILSSKDKKIKDKKRVSFKPEYQRSTSSMIRYMSSDEEENGMYNEDSTDKKVILQDQSMSKESPTLRLSIIAKRKTKINPFQKNLVEKLSNSQLLRSEKLAKKPNGGKFYMDNSFISDNLVNDSKLETDSDESNILQPSPEHHNAREPETFNTDKKIAELSEESEKGSPKFEAPSLRRIEETGKASSPSVEENEIEEQKMEKEESHPEEKIAPETVEKPQEAKGLFGNLGKASGSLFGQAPIQGLFGNNKPEEKPSLSRKNSPEVPAQPSLFNLNNSSPKEAESVVIPEQVSAPEPEVQQVVTEKPVENETAEEPPKVSYEEALKNPIFANVVSKTDDSVKMNNPFLNPTSAPSRGFNSLVSDIVQESAEVPAQDTNNEAPAPDNNPFLSRNQSVGILGILQSSQSTGPANTSSLFSNTLKPIGSMSWMNSNNNDQATKNLFGNLGGLSQPQISAPSQPSIFGQGFNSGGMNEDTMMQNTGNSLFNNNSNAGAGLFGGGSMQGNSGAGLFGGNNLGGGLNQEAMNSNPFLSGLGGGFSGNNQGGGMMRASSFSLDSGKKRGSQKERAF